MMNLKNINIEELEKLPYKQKCYHVIKQGRKVRNIVGQKKYKYRYPTKLQVFHRIVKGYIDRPVSELRARLKAAFVPTRRYPTVNSFIENDTERVTFLSNGTVRVIPTYSWRNSDNYDFLYVDKEDRLRYKPTIENKSNHKTKTPLEQSQYIIGIKREWKNRRKEEARISMQLLSLINKPLVLKYYRELAINYTSLERRLAYDKRRFSGRTDTKGLNIWDKFAFRDLEKDQKRLNEIKAEMLLFESGDLGEFYKSNVYLRAIALQKECHHFGNIPHKESELI